MATGLTKSQAKKLTAEIYSAVSDAQDLILKAWHGHADSAMGYKSWKEYCDTEFGNLWLRGLPREQRREKVRELRDAGMSQRAIADVAGVAKGTVQNDLSGQNCPPDQLVVHPGQPTVTGLDGRVYPRSALSSAHGTVGGPTALECSNPRKVTFEWVAKWVADTEELINKLTESERMLFLNELKDLISLIEGA